MQTFLPWPDFQRSAGVLDRQRLGKQRVETMQIARAITDPSYGWQNHPAVSLWRGHPAALLNYQVAVCTEWVSRGYRDTCLDKTVAILTPHLRGLEPAPPWLGDEVFHLSHRSNLLRKHPDHYAPLFEEGLPDDVEYFWPVVRVAD